MAHIVDLVGGSAIVAGFVAIAVAAATLVYNHFRDAKLRKIAALEAQLSGLYGPIAFLLAQNKAIFEQREAIDAAANAVNERNRGMPSEEITAEIDVVNNYGAKASDNNEKVGGLLVNAYHLLDDEDREIANFIAFHRVRSDIEGSHGKEKARLPPSIAHEMKRPILAHYSDYNERLLKKFDAKQAQVRKLRGA